MSRSAEPAITVLMPAYNAGRYIAQAIASVIAQTFEDWELLIVDDGSSDDTAAVAQSFRDRRIRYIARMHAGVSAALNHGLSCSQATYIARFDADDIMHPQRLEKQWAFLSLHPDHVLVGSDALYMFENGEPLFSFKCIGHTHEEIMDKLYTYCPFIHSSVMYRRRAVLAAGGYCVNAHNFEDYLLWTRLRAFGRFCNLPEQLVRIRFNPSSVTIDEKWRQPGFRALKRRIILRGSATDEEGQQLLLLIGMQDLRHLKAAAYHALCGKKLLTDNYQPAKARRHIVSSIRHYPVRADNYALLLASFLPHSWVQWIHKRTYLKL